MHRGYVRLQLADKAPTRTPIGCCANTCTRTPTGTLTQDALNSVAAKVNHRPRRVLGWATPAEAFGTAEPTPTLLRPA